MSREDPAHWSGDYYPATPGYQKHSATSKAAAESIAPKLGRLHEYVLSVFKQVYRDSGGGLTDEVLDGYFAPFIAAKTLRPRRIELTAQGYLNDSGRTRTTASGRQATVWIISQGEKP